MPPMRFHECAHEKRDAEHIAQHPFSVILVQWIVPPRSKIFLDWDIFSCTLDCTSVDLFDTFIILFDALLSINTRYFLKLSEFSVYFAQFILTAVFDKYRERA